MSRILLTLLLTCSVARAADTPASDASIRELLQVTDVKKLLAGMFPQIEAMMRASMQQALQGKSISPDDQRAMDRMTSKMMTMMQEDLSWEKLEPLYLSIYHKSFTQEEVDGMLAFYKSPAGAALIKKMPVVMQESMAAMQERMGPMMQKIQRVVEETVTEITAPKKKD